jgi:serine protease AprX
MVVAMMVAAEMAFAQGWDVSVPERLSPRIAAELNRELAQARQGAGGNKNVNVIVQYKQAPQQETLARLQNKGGQLASKLDLIKGAAFTLPVNALAALENDPDVEYVSVDHPLKGMDEYTNAAMNVSAAWNAGYDGTGVAVAVIDSGINPNHIDIWERVLYHQDFTGASEYNSNGALVYDTYGHGTHVAGIVAGSGYVSGGQYGGVATNANLIDLRVLDANGNGSDSGVIAAIQKAIALKSKYNIRVINLSLGRGVFVPYAKDPLCQAVESAWKSGIVVVAAAGNYGRVSLNGSDGYGTISAPGNDPLVITVGAMKANGTSSRGDDQIASYSSKGPTTFDHVVKPDLVAPGNAVVSLADLGSTLAKNYAGNMVSGYSNDYFTLSGTSMATPAVAGAVALLLEANPSLTPDQVKARLMKTAYKTFPVSSVATDPTTGQTYTSYYDAFTVGAGYLDLAAALANKDLAPATFGTALSPAAVYNSSTKKVTLANGNSQIAGSSVVWGTSIVWGSSIVWGTNVAGTSIVWGTSLVWGASTSSGFSVVWSTTNSSASSLVWGTSVINIDEAFVQIVGER